MDKLNRFKMILESKINNRIIQLEQEYVSAPDHKKDDIIIGGINELKRISKWIKEI